MDLRGYYDSVLGMWVRVSMARLAQSRPALFLDRDGVIVEETDYLCRAADTRLISGAAELIAAANAARIPVIELTNQAGIGRGYYGWNEFLEVEGEIARLLALHAREVAGRKFQYFFLSRNCAWRLAEMLELVLPEPQVELAADGGCSPRRMACNVVTAAC